MHKRITLFTLFCFLSVLMCGCAVRTYPVYRERVDQDLSVGNRGYLTGKPEPIAEGTRKSVRKLQRVEVEFRPIKFGQGPSVSVPKKSVSAIDDELESVTVVSESQAGVVVASPMDSKVMIMKKYKVLKGDTLQTISRKFYGTSKRWKEIYAVNQEILKAPDKIFAGQIIEIPVEEITGVK